MNFEDAIGLFFFTFSAGLGIYLSTLKIKKPFEAKHERAVAWILLPCFAVGTIAFLIKGIRYFDNPNRILPYPRSISGFDLGGCHAWAAGICCGCLGIFFLGVSSVVYRRLAKA